MYTSGQILSACFFYGHGKIVEVKQFGTQIAIIWDKVFKRSGENGFICRGWPTSNR